MRIWHFTLMKNSKHKATKEIKKANTTLRSLCLCVYKIY